MNVEETSVERRKAFLREFYPERYTKIKDMAIKAIDGTKKNFADGTKKNFVDNTKENFIDTCLEANNTLCKLDQEVFYSYLWQYLSIYY